MECLRLEQRASPEKKRTIEKVERKPKLEFCLFTINSKICELKFGPGALFRLANNTCLHRSSKLP